MRRVFSLMIALVIIFGVTFYNHAALIDMGDGTIYDTDMQLTWLKDAEMGGFRNWYDALTWVDNLVFAGFDDWRLPLADTSGDCGNPNTNTYDCTGSEMGHLYYTELGNEAAYGGPAPPLNTGPFLNLEQRAYWSGTGAPGAFAWAFNFSGGAQGAGMVVYDFGVWAVRPGERAPVLEPARHCVSTAQELHDALAEAKDNGRDDIIQIVQGNYVGNFAYAPTDSEPYDVTIEGGYSAECVSRVVDPANTVLDGENIDFVLELNGSTIPVNFVVDNMTLQHGNTWRGGGLYMITSGGNVNIMDCMILDNHANGDGGGVYVSGAEIITLNENTISYNDAASGGGFYIDGSRVININYNTISYNESRSGGALDVRQPTTVNLIGNTISHNDGRSWGGALIYTEVAANVTVAENTISYNTCSVGDGCGIYIQAETAIVKNNTISHNRLIGGGAGGIFLNASIGSFIGNIVRHNSGQDGGGVRYRGGSILLTNNIITNNYASLSGGGVIGGNLATETVLTNNTILNNHSDWRGGGLYLRLTEGVWSDVYNNIIYNNSSPSGTDIYLWNDIGAVINLYNNDFNQTSGIYMQTPFTIHSSNPDNADPLFVDPANDDFHLGPGSPCIDKGDLFALNLPLDDFEGDPRVVGPVPDMGADEYGILNILAFFDECVGLGTLEGAGKRVELRLQTMRCMLESAGECIEEDQTKHACSVLKRCYKRCDGEKGPPDSVRGVATGHLAGMIQRLAEILGCKWANESS